MKYERIQYRAPFSNVVCIARYNGKINAEQIKNALEKIVAMHPLLSSKIVLKGSKTYYVYTGNKEYDLKIIQKQSDRQWVSIAKEEQAMPFSPSEGKLARFILLFSEKTSDLILVVHHAICDGLSLIYLIKHITAILNGSMVSKIFLPSTINENTVRGLIKPSFPSNLLIKWMNRRWSKSKYFFSDDEYYDMFKRYWSQCDVGLKLVELDSTWLSKLIDKCHDYNVTVHSALCVALLLAQMKFQKKTYTDNTEVLNIINSAVNIRKMLTNDPGEAMGLYVSSISTMFKPTYENITEPLSINSYSHSYSNIDFLQRNLVSPLFWKHVCDFNRQFKKDLNSPLPLYLPGLLNSIEQSLLDAMYFHLYAGFDNEAAALMSKLYGFKKNRTSIGISNLGNVLQEYCDGKHNGGKHSDKNISIDTVFFLPPYWPNLEKMVGVVSAGGKMNITIQYSKSTVREEIIENIVKYLTSIV